MLSEIKIYRPNKKTNKLEHQETISKEEVKVIFDETLNKSQSHYVTRKPQFQSSGKKPHPNYRTKPNQTGNTVPDKYTPGATQRTCMMCKKKYYATNKRNTKFCSQKCGRDMSNEYKKERECQQRNGTSLLEKLKNKILRMK